MKLRVLVVDDHPLNLKLTRVLLEQDGYEVETAADAEQALEKLEAFAPRVILMDLQLPGMDGFELTRRLKANPATAHLVIIALTGWGQEGDKLQSREAGCNGHLVKPVSLPDLEKLLAEVEASQ